MTDQPNAEMIAADIELLHRMCGAADGKLVLASFGEDPDSGRKLRNNIEAFDVGDHMRMSARATVLTREVHRNVYVGFALMSSDLPTGRKGGEADIASVYGLVADFDAREDDRAHQWTDRLPMLCTMALQTSTLPEPSFQCRFLFKHPISVERAKSLARALQTFSGCDSCTADLSHVWRVAGSLNWPNQLKMTKYGRPPGGQLVRIVLPFDPNRIIDADELAIALGVTSERSDHVTAATGAPSASTSLDLIDLSRWNLSPDLTLVIELGKDSSKPKKQDNSRSAWLFHAVCGLRRSGVPDDVIFSIITNPGFKISESVIDKGRNATNYARRQIARAEAEASDTVLENFNTEHAVVENFGSKTVTFTFNEKGQFSYRSFEDFKRSYDHRKVQVQKDNRIRPVGQGTAFLDNPHRRQFRSVIFLPGREAEDGVLNLYRGPSIEPRAGECGLFEDFIFTVVCDGETDLCDWLLNYIAHLYQKPWETPEVCIVLRGRQGVGKNVFVECIGGIVSEYFITISNAKHLVGGFNRHLMDKLVVFADEAFYGNERRYAGILKNLVTQSMMAVEPKGVDVFMAKKYFRLFMASNENFVVPADLDDRRFFVLDVSDAHAKDHEYFAALRAEWDNGGREAFYDLMLKRDIAEFNFRDRPETAGLAEQKMESLVGASRLVFEMLTSGEAPIPTRQLDANFIATEALRHSYARRGLRVTSRSLAIELEGFAMHEGSKRETIVARQVRGFWVPSLRECRDQWAKSKRLNIPWPDDDGEWIDTYEREIV